jgi:hypothetical protein
MKFSMIDYVGKTTKHPQNGSDRLTASRSVPATIFAHVNFLTLPVLSFCFSSSSPHRPDDLTELQAQLHKLRDLKGSAF